MTDLPRVTVICTCYNHAQYVVQALDSVLMQTYQNVQLIIVDNASTDKSADVIKKFIAQHSSVIFIENKINLGICKAFNIAVGYSDGKYLIDLSADDVLLPNRIEHQITEFEKLDDSYGMMYSNIEYINKSGKLTGNSCHKKNYPSGNIFQNILAEYIIPSPSTIFKKSVFLKIGGYNDLLAFEDFDFWVRCAFYFNIQFTAEITTQKRILKDSFSTAFYSTNSDKMLRSTLATYAWAKEKLRNSEENQAYQKGMNYYFGQCILLGHFSLAKVYLTLMEQPSGLKNKILLILLRKKINLSFFQNFTK